jgi:predicted TPR repeat methyltransferase
MLAACRHQSVPERASNAYVEAVFDGFASVFDQRLKDLEYHAPELVGQLVSRRAAGAAGALRILDAGCGTGLCGPSLRPYASRLTGVDLSARMLERARSLDCYDRLVRAELGAFLGGGEEEFDLIVSADTLVYFGELATILHAVSGALAPGGSLIATLERAEEAPAPGYRLNAHGRYSHSEGYVRSVCRDCGLRLDSLRREVLRQEMGQPVAGLLFEAVKDADPPTRAVDRAVPG